ncbi:MAG TPA: chemotaxis-specific protein-glutamate methyltransferase CheB [Anaerolineae bacterium]|nr:chemotaxis-specific protein-glutamate methyltransferase CheB [Anaerolineae bacterium]
MRAPVKSQRTGPIRILIVDDSPVIREILTAMFRAEPDFEVIGEAQDGHEAVQFTAALRPDVITMDLHMPRMTGVEAIRQIMNTTPTPITVVASGIHEDCAVMAAQALAAGALTMVEKPRGISPQDYGAIQGQLTMAIRLVAGVELVSLAGGAAGAADFIQDNRPKLVAIGASTGGPGILHRILHTLPSELNFPIIVVQHITAGFGAGFVRWLDSVTEIKVQLAQDNEPVRPGCVWVAPEGHHLTVQSGGVIHLDASAPLGGVRPSANRLFTSVAETYQSAAVGIILTGMGVDGADGLEELWRVGGYTIAQDEASCVVFGMPKVAIERGVVRQVLTPDEIATFLTRLNEQCKNRE